MKLSTKLWNEAIAAKSTNNTEALDALSKALWDEGNFDESIAVNQEIRDIFRSTGSLEEWADATWVTANKCFCNDDFLEALCVIDEVIEQVIASNDSHNAAFLSHLKGKTLIQLGREFEAIQTLEIARELFEQDDEFEMLGYTATWIAHAFSTLDLWQEAANYHRLAIRSFARESKPLRVLELKLTLANALRSALLHLEARAELSDALNISRFLGNQDFEQKALRALGNIHSLLGDKDNAESLFRAAMIFKANIEQQKEAAYAMKDLSEHNIRFGELELGQRQRSEVQSILNALGIS